MSQVSKRVKKINELVDRTKSYELKNALDLVKKTATAKFDESVDVAVNLGIDAKKSDQVVRGSVVLPRGTGKTVRVAVFAQGANAEKAAPTSSASTTSPRRSRAASWSSTW
jgi:large subunit ribosomal protein L1